MNGFWKIGLPWAISLGIVFFAGLQLGQNKKTLPDAGIDAGKPENKSNTGSLSGPRKDSDDGIKKVEVYKPKTTNPELSDVKSPPLPPNLIRIMKGGGVLERMGSYLDALRSMDLTNTQDVVGAFEALPKGYGRHLEMKLLMRSWSAIDPEAALEYARMQLDEKSERRFGISEALAGWANKDPNAARAWAKANNPASEQKDNPYILGVIKGISESDLEAANRELQGLPYGNAKWQAATFLAQEYSKKSPEEAIAWANQFPADSNRLHETVIGQVAARIAREDLEGTAQWVATMPSGSANQRVMDNLLNQWVSRSPEGASVWAAGLEDADKRSYAMKRLASRWSLNDPVATAKWLNEFPPSAELDPVVGEFVNRIRGRDPEGAAGWALSIVDPASRKEAVKKIVQTWKTTDPERAEAWMQSNQIQLD